jgi:hypothetical protein
MLSIINLRVHIAKTSFSFRIFFVIVGKKLSIYKFKMCGRKKKNQYAHYQPQYDYGGYQQSYTNYQQSYPSYQQSYPSYQQSYPNYQQGYPNYGDQNQYQQSYPSPQPYY